MIGWIFVFTNINILLGVDFVAEFDSQNDLSYFWRVFIQTWKNSLGDQAAPYYRQWDKMQKIHYEDSEAPTYYIIFIWAVWIINQLFIAVVLINFLIAMVTQNYEKVMQ